MRAVYLSDGKVSLRSAPRPAPRQGFALIRPLYGGICNTDIELLKGYYGFRGTPGHEFVGEVLSGSRELIGRRVVGEININCSRCAWCRRGLGRHCPHRTVLGIVKHPGAFAEFLSLPERNLHVVPPEIPSQHAVFVEPLAAACEILEQVAIPAGAAVAVLGDGKLGLLVAQALQARGARVHLFGRHRHKLRIAEKSGVTGELRGAKLPVAAYDYVVEATGSREGLEQAVAMARPRGTVVIKSTVHGAVRLDTAPVVVNEITLVGSRCGLFPPALELLASGRIHVAEMISDSFPLEQAPAAFRRAQQKGVLKVLLCDNRPTSLS
ncbi:MAG TPA: alcohol dehydrogenase catalytic domain-containing protein [Bryobacterales bacterium]|nr:alcohol dehydrogenase catalytic domain-containing protein [Bryobacterales bacterium]